MSGDELDDIDPRDAARLNEWIRRARPEDDAGRDFDPRLLLAYLRGAISPEDSGRVQNALADSTELRREFLYMAGLYDRDIQARFDAVVTPDPVRAAHVEAPAHAPPPRLVEWRPPRRRWPVPVWGLAAAAGLALFLLVGRLDDRGVPWRAQGTLVADQLVPDTRRGAGDPPAPAAEARAAAILGLAALLDAPDAPAISVPPDAPRAIRRFRVDGTDFEAVVPAAGTELMVWLLDRPGLALQSAALPPAGQEPAGPDGAPGPIRLARRALDAADRLVVTYPVPGGYGSSPLRPVTPG